MDIYINVLCAGVVSHAQQPISIKPDINLLRSPLPMHEPVAVLGVYGVGTKLSYVRTRESLVPISDESRLDVSGYREVRVKTEYADGLGRPLQRVLRQGCGR